MDANLYMALALGLAVGAILALTGAGGAIIAVPLLVFGLGLPIAEASPIALLAVAFAAFVGALMGFRSGILRYKAATVMSVFGLCLSPLGLWTASRIPNGPLISIFSIVLLYVSFNMYRHAKRELQGIQPDESYGPLCTLHEVHGKLIWTLPCFRAMIASGAIAGFLSGLLGVGGGFVIVPALKRVTNLPARSIIATSLGVITLVSIGGVVGATLSGSMNWNIALPFATGALVGMLAGRSVGERMRGPHLQQAFAVFAFVVSISMMYKAVS
jgi:uncharacterized membrane protein YfcA